MPREPENLVLKLLRDIRADQDAQGKRLSAIEGWMKKVDKRLDDLQHATTYNLGQSAETGLRQTRQGKRLDELFDKVEKILANDGAD